MKHEDGVGQSEIPIDQEEQIADSPVTRSGTNVFI